MTAVTRLVAWADANDVPVDLDRIDGGVVEAERLPRGPWLVRVYPNALGVEVRPGEAMGPTADAAARAACEILGLRIREAAVDLSLARMEAGRG